MNYLIHRDGTQYGPYDEAAIERMIAESRVSGSDLCWTEGSSEWRAILDCPRLARFFPSAPKPTPLTPVASTRAPAKGPGGPPVGHPQAGSGGESAMLTVLCVITILGSIFGVLRGMTYNSLAGMAHESGYLRGWGYILSNAGTLTGAITMLCRSIVGLYLYTFAQVGYILLVLFSTYVVFGQGELMGPFSALVGAFFWLPSVVFLVLYWLPVTRRGLR